jgi:hypothetical protein
MALSTGPLKYVGWNIVCVEDTRQRDDNGQVVPYSGEQRPCDCCGRAIDVLVTICPVEHSSKWQGGRIVPVIRLGNQSAIVGMTCAKKYCCQDLRNTRAFVEASQ